MRQRDLSRVGIVHSCRCCQNFKLFGWSIAEIWRLLWHRQWLLVMVLLANLQFAAWRMAEVLICPNRFCPVYLGIWLGQLGHCTAKSAVIRWYQIVKAITENSVEVLHDWYLKFISWDSHFHSLVKTAVISTRKMSGLRKSYLACAHWVGKSVICCKKWAGQKLVLPFLMAHCLDVLLVMVLCLSSPKAFYLHKLCTVPTSALCSLVFILSWKQLSVLLEKCPVYLRTVKLVPIE